MAIRVCPLCQAEFLEFKSVCSHCDVALVDPDDDTDPRRLDADDQVVYELGGWPIDAQAEASQVLAESGIPHIWQGTDVLMPLLHEAAADRLLEAIEREYGLEEGGAVEIAGTNGDLVAGGETEYDVAAWPTPRRMELVERLVELSVPHRWEGLLLLVPTNLEPVVDQLLDEMEGGTLADLDDDDELNADLDELDAEAVDDDALDPAEALSSLFLAGERMRKHKVDVDTYGGLLTTLELSDPERPPYGFDQKLWEQALELAEDLADAVAEDTDDVGPLAEQLYHLLRPFV